MARTTIIDMSAKQRNHIAKAVEVARSSSMFRAHGCIITKGKKIMCSGRNDNRRTRIRNMNVPSTHAEQDACSVLSKLTKRHFQKGSL